MDSCCLKPNTPKRKPLVGRALQKECRGTGPLGLRLEGSRLRVEESKCKGAS